MEMSLRKLWEMLKDRETFHSAVCGVTKSQTQLSDWTKPSHIVYLSSFSIDKYHLSQNIENFSICVLDLHTSGLLKNIPRILPS